MKFHIILRLVIYSMLGIFADASALPMGYDTHNRLLYTTHCVSCHITQQNWQDEKVANNWINLRTEVTRWQRTSTLESHDGDDLASVANYLNNFIFYCH